MLPKMNLSGEVKSLKIIKTWVMTRMGKMFKHCNLLMDFAWIPAEGVIPKGSQALTFKCRLILPCKI